MISAPSVQFGLPFARGIFRGNQHKQATDIHSELVCCEPDTFPWFPPQAGDLNLFEAKWGGTKVQATKPNHQLVVRKRGSDKNGGGFYTEILEKICLGWMRGVHPQVWPTKLGHPPNLYGYLVEF